MNYLQQTIQSRLEAGIQTLQRQGLNLFAIIKHRDLPDSAKRSLAPFALTRSDNCHIILIGHGGKALWSALSMKAGRETDPIDRHSREAAVRFAEQVLVPSQYQLIYPGQEPVALQQMGALAGWHNPSPLGLGINPDWGLWYAYRAALLTDAPLPEIAEPQANSPCHHCEERSCLSACPAQALAVGEPIDMARCGCYRLAPDSACADRCLARIECPVAPEHRYTLEQIQYHYRLSLESLRHYANGLADR